MEDISDTSKGMDSTTVLVKIIISNWYEALLCAKYFPKICSNHVTWII